MDKLIANYIKYLEEIKHLNPKTIKVYKFQIRNMIEYNNYKNIVDLQNSNIIQLNKWVNSKNEMSNQYQNQMIASAKSFFGYLMAYRLISYNPSKELKALKIETKGVVGNTGQIEEIKEYLKKEYGHKIYKLALNGGMSCPNRDGLIDTRGCIFCSAGGSGDFAGGRAG